MKSERARELEHRLFQIGGAVGLWVAAVALASWADWRLGLALVLFSFAINLQEDIREWRQAERIRKGLASAQVDEA